MRVFSSWRSQILKGIFKSTNPLPTLPLSSRKQSCRKSRNHRFRYVNHYPGVHWCWKAGAKQWILRGTTSRGNNNASTVLNNSLARDVVFLLGYCCAASAVVISRIVMNMEAAALGASNTFRPCRFSSRRLQGKGVASMEFRRLIGKRWISGRP